MKKETWMAVLFYFLMFSFFFQTRFAPFGKGQFIDYLIPFVYLSDLSIILLSLSSLILFPKDLFYYLKNFWQKRKAIVIVLFFFLTSMAVSNLRAQNQLIAWFNWFKLINFSIFVLNISFLLSDRLIDVKKSFLAINIGLALEALIALGELITQRSLGLQPFGEWRFSALTPGIAKTLVGTTQLLRPYATFPHPNVLGTVMVFFAVSSLYFLLADQDSNQKYKLLRLFFFLLFSLAGFVSFSRTAWLIYFVLVLTCLIIFMSRSNHSNKIIRSKAQRFFSLKRYYLIIFLFLSLALIISPVVFQRIASLGSSDRLSLEQRIDLIKAAAGMIKNHPLFGVGLANFTSNLTQFGSILFPYRLFQPVHNVWLLVLSETGLVGFTSWLFLLLAVIRQITKKELLRRWWLVFFLITFLLSSQLDHFWWTLQAGQLFFWLMIGLSINVD